MCDLIEPQPTEKVGRMKKLRRTLSESFSRIATQLPLQGELRTGDGEDVAGDPREGMGQREGHSSPPDLGFIRGRPKPLIWVPPPRHQCLWRPQWIPRGDTWSSPPSGFCGHPALKKDDTTFDEVG
ncbi:Serine/threonine-protein kinase PFTAIRE-1 [Cricetulus griseus]|uniref:Serine/threonine-protein kinase PFTAIRE-1 n=1 Tax=Cricetulus griseus TaxID=10029 RepID=G3HL88_CRIGR|nr:Serine/threonine-protein kinase PFTAIRE-1 [Cricetulus griseus]ERE91459.1 cyclin-dependent kinase 14 [Cricetulus griseus]